METAGLAVQLRFAALVALALAAPWVLDPQPLRMVARMAVFALFALSVNLLLGVTGIASLGHGLFFGAGGYGVALLWYHDIAPPLLMLALAPIVGAVLAAASGCLTFRARDLYFALITVGLVQAVYVLVTQWYSVTRGEDGVYGIRLPDALNDLDNRYRFVVALVALAIVAMRVLVASPFGTTLKAIRQNRDRVEYLGVRVRPYEFAAWVASGAFAAFAGALLVVFEQTAFPNVFHWSFSATPLLMAIIGGTTYFYGPFVGAVFAIFVQDGVDAWSERTNLVYGLAVLAVALIRRDGVLGILEGVGSAVRPKPRRRAGAEQSGAAAAPPRNVRPGHDSQLASK